MIFMTKQIAIFLDRDGTINKYVKDIHTPNQFKLLKNAPKAIRLLNKIKIPVIVVTNQPAVAKGFCTIRDIQKINKKMVNELRKYDAKISAVYFCPHHPEKGWPGENPKYKINCNCRKPKIGMLLKAKKRFGLNLKKCFMIGDETRDVQTGKNAGCTTILLKTGKRKKDPRFKAKPDYICRDLYQAAKLIAKILGAEKCVH